MSADSVPNTWRIVDLQDIAEINPSLGKREIAEDTDVSFVPMQAVEAETGRIDVSRTRKFSEVKKGYTSFAEGDVLFAKITPCMENGKMAVVPSLQNGLGFGSTEFHVLRARGGIDPGWLYYFVSSLHYRNEAQHKMTGAVGQKRVTTAFVEQSKMPVAPSSEQKRIVEKIEELFSELDKGIESLKVAREQLKAYRQAVLKQAFEGKLTEDWRKRSNSTLSSPEAVSAKIRQHRQAVFQNQVEEWKRELALWERNGEAGKRPSKPRGGDSPDRPSPEHVQKMWKAPTSWQWLQIGDFAFVTKLAGFEYTDYVKYDDAGDLPVIKAENAGILGFKPTNYSRVQSSAVAHLKRSYLNGGELLIVFVGAGTGNVATVPHGEKFFLGPNIGMARVETDQIDTEYLELFLRSPWGKDMILATVKAVAQPSISMGTIRQTPVIVPPVEEQKEIVRLLKENLSAIERMDDEIEDGLKKSESLRQSILKKAFSGQLVPQDPNDEPASVLLERIRAEKAAQPKKKRSAA